MHLGRERIDCLYRSDAAREHVPQPAGIDMKVPKSGEANEYELPFEVEMFV